MSHLTRTHSPLTLFVAISLCVTLAGCGSASKSTSTNAALAGASPQYTAPLRYSDCMRAHGVPNFPDPTSGGGLLVHAGPGTGLDPISPAFQSAQQSCRSLIPGGGAPHLLSASRRNALLQYSACMRAHGLSNFPDPIFSSGGAQLRFTPSSGINPASPAFKTAQTACGPRLQKLARGVGIGG